MNLNDEYKKYREEGRIEFITFHPSYSYEEFVEGIRAKTVKKNVTYEVEPGVFKRICERAEANYDKATAKKKDPDKYVVIIDEINRGNIPKIFGELITLIEADKRKGMPNCLSVTLPYSGEDFCVPPNLHIIGTMNTADTSIALIDIALRRRFSFIELSVDYEALISNLGFSSSNEVETKAKQGDIKALSIQALRFINLRILEDTEHLGKEKQIGHSYLWDIDHGESAVMAWRYDILPLLQEYLYGRYDDMAAILGDDGILIDKDSCAIRDFNLEELTKGLKKAIE